MKPIASPAYRATMLQLDVIERLLTLIQKKLPTDPEAKKVLRRARKDLLACAKLVNPPGAKP